MEKRLIEVKKRLLIMKGYYKDRGIPDKYYDQSLSDLYYRYRRFEAQNGYHGLSEWDIFWLEDVFNAKFFDIGVLRFQIFKMDYTLIERQDYDYMPLSEEVKLRFPQGQYYINIHINKGADLSVCLVEESLNEARVFFKTYFQDYHFQYFICRTWLLDESLEALLPPESKILRFRNRFEILARNYHQGHPLVRIYGSDDLQVISQMEHKSSLQKKAYLQADKLGVSFGCIPF